MADSNKVSASKEREKVVESGSNVKVNKGKALVKTPKKDESKSSLSSLVKNADKILNLLEVMQSSFDRQLKKLKSNFDYQGKSRLIF